MTTKSSAGTGATAATPLLRQTTGSAGLDEILCGGLPAARSHLLIGAAGTGKTLLSTQWLRAGVALGEKALYVALMEPIACVERNIAPLGWTLGGIETEDLSPRGLVDTRSGEEYQVFSPGEVERANVWRGVYDAVERVRPARLVIDSVTQLRYLSTDDYQFRKHLLHLVAFLADMGCTTLLPFEPDEARAERAVELAADGILQLKYQISESLSLGLRTVEVTKLRGSDFMSGRHPFRITGQGMEVFPHRVERTADSGGTHRRSGTGVARLDELLGGGLEAGTTTLLSGPTGVGKTTLGMHVLCNAPAGERAVLLSFEEPRDTILARARAIGLDMDAAVRDGRLQVMRINPLERYPDELLAMVRDMIERQGVRHLMLDSLRGYELAMQEFGKPEMHIHNLLAYLGRMQVTTLVVAEADAITGAALTATEIGVSHLADNIILLRYAELKARLIKVIGCLKKRLGPFEPELREMTITAQGIQVSRKLEELRGILSGTPTLSEGFADRPAS